MGNSSESSQIIEVIGCVAPMLTSLLCCLILLYAYFRDWGKPDTKPVGLMIIAYLCSIFSWIGLGAYVVFPVAFAYMQSFIYLFMLLTQVIIYHIVYTLTVTQKDERFSPIHYIVPSLITGALFVWSFFVPFDVQLAIVHNRNTIPEGYEAYAILFTSKPPVFLLYNIVYSLLGLWRIRRYRKISINYTADEYRSSMRWLYTFFFLTLGTIPMTLVFLLLGDYTITRPALGLLPILLTMFQDIILCYNLFTANYILISVREDEKEYRRTRSLRLSGEEFERYIEDEKPYLNPELKITHIADRLQISRSSLSAFINIKYGMNFSRYINLCRLKEYERIKNNPAFFDLSRREQILKAGFSNYYTYRRTQNYEENDFADFEE